MQERELEDLVKLETSGISCVLHAKLIALRKRMACYDKKIGHACECSLPETLKVAEVEVNEERELGRGLQMRAILDPRLVL